MIAVNIELEIADRVTLLERMIAAQATCLKQLATVNRELSDALLGMASHFATRRLTIVDERGKVVCELPAGLEAD